MSDTTIKYAYQKLMAENKLTVAQLPEDAKIGITAIMNIEKAISMAEKKGKKISPDTIAKIKANDKWVVNEILDFLDDTDKNADEIPHEEEEVIDEIKETIEGKGDDDDSDVDDDDSDVDDDDSDDDDSKDTTKDETKEGIAKEKEKALGLLIEGELAEMHTSGKVDWHSDEIKAKYKNTYNTLFDNYVDGEENGIETTNYKLLEKSEEIFTISKK
jgi:hypothetical protein